MFGYKTKAGNLDIEDMAVIFKGKVYCYECWPLDEGDYEVDLINSEDIWMGYPTCVACGKLHTYVKLRMPEDD